MVDSERIIHLCRVFVRVSSVTPSLTGLPSQHAAFGRSCQTFHHVAGVVDAVQELNGGILSTITKHGEAVSCLLTPMLLLLQFLFQQSTSSINNNHNKRTRPIDNTDEALPFHHRLCYPLGQAFGCHWTHSWSQPRCYP